jgi:SAM-dependent methyltransferase
MRIFRPEERRHMSEIVPQKELFERIHEDYYEGAADPYYTAFREEFINNWVLSNLGDSRSLIELASGIGVDSRWLREKRPFLEITGCDISERAAEDFSRINGRPCYVADLTKPFYVGRKFDSALVMGGLHHMVADLDTAFQNIGSLLDTGGRLIISEPSADYVMEPLRRLWYRADTKYFDPGNERALSHDALFREYGAGFRLVALKYFGGPAYFGLGLGFILRLPNRAKRWTGPVLLPLERLYDKLPGRWPYASFLSCWEKL